MPPQVVLQQVGREAVLDEAVRRGLPELVRGGGARRRHRHRRRPEVDLSRPAREGRAARVHDRGGRAPTAKLGDYKGLEVGRREPQVDAGRGAGRARARCASRSPRSRPSSARPATGDFVVLDFVGTVDGEPFEGGEARGYLLELGSGRLIAGLRGAAHAARSAGDEREVNVTFPDDYRAEHLAGKRGRRSPSTSRRSRRSGCPSSTTTSPSRPAASTRSTSCARTSRRASREAEERAIEARVPRGRRRRRGREARDRRSPRAGPREGARDVAPHRAPPRSARAWTRRSTSR